jgi:hypothetical protein
MPGTPLAFSLASELDGKIQFDPDVLCEFASSEAGSIERVGFAVFGVVINAIDAAGGSAGANGLNVTLDARLVADIKAIASAVPRQSVWIRAIWQQRSALIWKRWNQVHARN